MISHCSGIVNWQIRLCCLFECRMRLSLHSINFRYGNNFLIEKFLSLSQKKNFFPVFTFKSFILYWIFLCISFFHLLQWFHLVSVHVLVEIKVSMSKTIFHNKLMVKLCDINGMLNIRIILWANSNKSRVMTNVFFVHPFHQISD